MPLPQEDVSCEWMVMHRSRCGDFPGEGDLPAKMEMVEGRVAVGAQGQSPRPQAQLQPMRPGPRSSSNLLGRAQDGPFPCRGHSVLSYCLADPKKGQHRLLPAPLQPPFLTSIQITPSTPAHDTPQSLVSTCKGFPDLPDLPTPSPSRLRADSPGKELPGLLPPLLLWAGSLYLPLSSRR